MRSERDGAELQTPRLHLRAWRDEDLDELAALCADPAVMRHFPATLNREQSQALLHSFAAAFRGAWLYLLVALEPRG